MHVVMAKNAVAHIAEWQRRVTQNVCGGKVEGKKFCLPVTFVFRSPRRFFLPGYFFTCAVCGYIIILFDARLLESFDNTLLIYLST